MGKDLVKTKIRHANILNSAKENLSRDQRRTLYMCLMSIQENDWPESGFFKLSSRDYANIYGISLDEATKDMRKAIDDFDGKSVILYDEFDGVQVEGKAHWTSSTWKSVDPQKGFCWVKLNSDLKKYLMPVANDLPFTISLIEDLGRLKLKYSQRLYALLAQYRSTGVLQVSARQIFERWELPESYEKWSLMKMRVIEPAVEELRRCEIFRTLSYVQKNTTNAISLQFTFTPCPE